MTSSSESETITPMHDYDQVNAELVRLAESGRIRLRGPVARMGGHRGFDEAMRLEEQRNQQPASATEEQRGENNE